MSGIRCRPPMSPPSLCSTLRVDIRHEGCHAPTRAARRASSTGSRMQADGADPSHGRPHYPPAERLAILASAPVTLGPRPECELPCPLHVRLATWGLGVSSCRWPTSAVG